MPIINTVYKKKKGWKPNANTVAYYPLTADTQLTDQSGNGHNLTKNGTVTFGTYGGLSCCYINIGMLHSQINNVSASGGITESIWYYETNSPQNDNGTILYLTTNIPTGSNTRPNGTIKAQGRPNSKYGIVGYVDDGSTATTPPSNVTIGVWYNAVYTYSGTTGTLYVNGNLIGTLSKTDTYDTKSYVAISRSVDMNRSIRGYVSEAIVENKVRTADEILAYYNQTKANYGL